MARRRGEVGKRRREQIVEAAVAIIAEEGLHELSLSAIEKRAGMSRGQLTYYFHTKEDILLAVFDHMIDQMRNSAPTEKGCHGRGLPPAGWERLRAFLTWFLLNPPNVPVFHALQYTFLAQLGHRDDFRRRLADLYDGWRTDAANDVQGDLIKAGCTDVSARTVASFVQAVLHGISIQRVADPDAFDSREMLALFLGLLGGLLGKNQPAPAKKKPSRRPSKAGEP